MDKNDMFAFFWLLKSKYNNDTEILSLFENVDISKLDINRIYRYLEKYTKENTSETDEKDEIDEL
jgi:hypothetical protein